MSQPFYFALCPRFLKVQHSFAKNIVPGTDYRLALYKGIQKCDQMKVGQRSKIVGGKIQMNVPQLTFNIPYYSATKNIKFSIKLYETKPSKEQVQIASYEFGSFDYIKQFNSQKQNSFQVTGQFKQDLFLHFDLFIEKSKQLLNDLVKSFSPNPVKDQKQSAEDIKSISGRSKQLIREGQGFISPRRRIQRKRGHQNKFRSRSRSRSKSQQNDIKSPLKEDPTKSIPKSQASSNSIKKPQSTVNSGTRDSKTYQYQPANKLKYTDTKQIFDIQVQRGNSPLKSPRNVEQKGSKSPQQNRANFTSPRQSDSTLQTENKTNSSPNPASSINNQSKTNPFTSPKNVSSNLENMEVKHTTKVFDIAPKQNANPPTIQSPRSPTKYEPKRSPRIATYEPAQEQNPAKNQISQKEIPNLENSKSKLGSSLNTPFVSQNMKQSKINIVLEGAVNQPKAVIIQKQNSVSQKDDIKVSARPLTKSKNVVHQSSTLKGSLRLSQAIHSKQHYEQIKRAQKTFEQKKNQILYGIFLVVSIFLIYNAMLPTRRV